MNFPFRGFDESAELPSWHLLPTAASAAASGRGSPFHSLAVMSAPFTYAEAKSVLIEVLKRDVALHEAKRYSELGANFDEIDERLPRNAGVEFSKLIFAHEFWAGWQDSAEHDWFFYEPIHENDWPRFAKTLIENLSNDRESTDPVLLNHFAPRPKKPSLLSRIKSCFHTGRQK